MIRLNGAKVKAWAPKSRFFPFIVIIDTIADVPIALPCAPL